MTAKELRKSREGGWGTFCREWSRRPSRLTVVTLATGVWLLLPIVLGTALAAPPTISAPQPATEAYYRWMHGCLDALDRDLPQITASADAAARLYVEKNYNLFTGGWVAFQSEAGGRAGGLMQILKVLVEGEAQVRAESVVLFVPREEALAEDFASIRRLIDKGCTLILIGRTSLLDEARKAGLRPATEVDIHAAPHGGLFQDTDGEWIVPTDPWARTVAQWVWTGEFVAACTRLGKMPTMWKSFGAEGGFAWRDANARKRYHDFLPSRVLPGTIGRAYLDAVRQDLRTIYGNELGRIVQVAQWATEARSAGRHVYSFTNAHGLLLDPGCPHDPQYFRRLAPIQRDPQTGVVTLDFSAPVAPGDVIFCVMQGQMPVKDAGYPTDLPTQWRTAGARCAWSFGNVETRLFVGQVGLIEDDEIFIDQHFHYGDAAVWIEGYPIPILPDSAVAGEAVLWMATAEVFGRLHPASGDAAASEQAAQKTP